jgi:hypothetical protein
MFLLRSFLLGTMFCFGVSLMAQDAQTSIETLPRADRITTTEPVAKKSPMNSASIRSEAGYARIVYSQPMLRGRQMLGDQVPYGKVWRAGANEATELFTTARLELKDEAQSLAPGAYSLFIIPQADRWTIIFNKDLGQWGAYNYDESHDVLRVDVPVQSTKEAYEAFTTFFEGEKLVMAWGETRVELPFVMVEADTPAKPKRRVLSNNDGE